LIYQAKACYNKETAHNVKNIESKERRREKMNNIRIVEKHEIEDLPVGIKLEEVRVFYEQPSDSHHKSGQRVLLWARVEQENGRRKLYEIDKET